MSRFFYICEFNCGFIYCVVADFFFPEAIFHIYKYNILRGILLKIKNKEIIKIIHIEITSFF